MLTHSEDEEMLALPDPVSQLLDLPIQLLWGIEILLFLLLFPRCRRHDCLLLIAHQTRSNQPRPPADDAACLLCNVMMLTSADYIHKADSSELSTITEAN